MKRGLVLGIILGAGVMVMAAGLVAQQPGQQPPGQGQGGQGRGGGQGGPQFGPVGKIEKVANNLYMIPGAGGNTAVLVAANGVVLVDTKVEMNGPALLEQVKTVTNKAVTHIINTHTHFDHTGSNQDFPATVEIVTHENTAANMQKMPVFQQAANKHGLPDKTYKDRTTVLGGNDSIDLYHFGPAHTNGDSFVVFRSLRVMHAGDVFPNKGQPFIDTGNGGSGRTYAATIAKAAAGIKSVDTVIPGHAALMKWQDFVDYGEFNRLYLEHARASLKAGKTPEQALADLKLPDKFKDYNLQGGGRGAPGGNFNVIYEELKKP
jgi:glyoxylase-like metal-dependent hydrolase (beta-lactamase superfamily II)